LVYLANQASLELHVPLSRLPELENPDRLVIDLDPPDDVRIGVLREVARAARKLFETVGLVPFVQTTGGRGFHVAAPLDAKSDYDLVHPFARRLADRIAARRPDELTTEQRKDQRGQRVFLDTNRNAYAQTTVAPYSPRARAAAPAATPLDWSELSRVTPDAYGLGNLGHRLARKADPWADFDKHARSAAEASQRLAELD